MRFQFIHRHVEEFHITVMCRVLRVSKAGYYAWRIRQTRPASEQSPRVRANADLCARIRRIYDASRATYGSPRIYRELIAHDVACSENRVARLMRTMRLQGVCRRHRRRPSPAPATTPAAPNILDRRFTEVTAPNTVWTADITYIRTGEGWLYLAVVIDLGSKRVVGFSMQPSLDRSLTVDALLMALHHRRPTTAVLHHSDRGSQYASTEYQHLLTQHGLTASMSRTGNCYDNAVTESFFATLKTELVYRTIWPTHADAKHALFEYIEVWYNRQRRHSSLGYMSPTQYERQHAKQYDVVDESYPAAIHAEVAA